MTAPINNLHVSSFEPIESPDELKREIPVLPAAAETVLRGREEIRAALRG